MSHIKLSGPHNYYSTPWTTISSRLEKLHVCTEHNITHTKTYTHASVKKQTNKQTKNSYCVAIATVYVTHKNLLLKLSDT